MQRKYVFFEKTLCENIGYLRARKDSFREKIFVAF
jgi:hypothetical protein